MAQSHYPIPKQQQQQQQQQQQLNNDSRLHNIIMLLSIGNVIMKFPNKRLPIINGEPAHTSITTFGQDI
jgi:hypothetical protein